SAEAQLRGWAKAFAGECGLPTYELSVVPPLHDDEANGRALTLGSGLVSIDPTGRFRTASGAASKGPYNLFSRGPAPGAEPRVGLRPAGTLRQPLRHPGPVSRGVSPALGNLPGVQSCLALLRAHACRQPTA